MDIIQAFIGYAGDFEKTYVDDDWSRLHRYFADDAVYEVKSDSFGCRLVGPAAIFRGMKKSLDGFDRKFTKRDIAITSGPEVSGNEMRVGWEVTYEKEGLSPFVLRGHSVARYAGDKIAYLSDGYDPSVTADFQAWEGENDFHLDPSYT
jgi:hypothetical protein